MQKRRLGKRLAVTRETLHRLDPGELQQAAGGAVSGERDSMLDTYSPDLCRDLSRGPAAPAPAGQLAPAPADALTCTCPPPQA
jgi:hypothetical protein